jgi:hypothetical protein
VFWVTKQHSMKVYVGMEASRSLNLCIRWSSIVKCTLRLLVSVKWPPVGTWLRLTNGLKYGFITSVSSQISAARCLSYTLTEKFPSLKRKVNQTMSSQTSKLLKMKAVMFRRNVVSRLLNDDVSYTWKTDMSSTPEWKTEELMPLSPPEIKLSLYLCPPSSFVTLMLKYDNYVNSLEQSPPQNRTVSQIVKKFPAFYGTRRFITAFTKACHLSLS